MEVFRSILPITFYITINCGLCILLKKRFGECLPFAFLSSIVIVFLSQVLFKTFTIGLYVLILFFLFSLYLLAKNKDKKEYYLTNGLTVFLCLCILFLFIDFGRRFFLDDEFGFWGKMVKEMIRMDRFYYLDESTLRGHNDYPPFIPLFEYIWCRLSLGFSECNCTVALHLLEFGIFLPALFDRFFLNDSFRKRIQKDSLISLVFTGIIVFLDASNTFNAIYTDLLIGIEYAYSIFLVFFREENHVFNDVCYVLILSTILMTKQVGIAFYLLSVFFFTICHVLKRNSAANLLSAVCIVLIPVGFYLLWNKLIQPFDIIKQFDLSKISVSGFADILKGNSYQLETVKLYVNALFKTDIYQLFIPITFLSSLLLDLFLLEVMKNTSESDSRVLKYEITCFVGTGGYAFMMLILYSFCYPEREALVLQSYSRYMSSFLTGIFLSILILFTYKMKTKIEAVDCKNLFISTLLILCMLDGNRLLNFVPQLILGDRAAGYRTLAEKLSNKIEDGSLVYVLYDHDGPDSCPSFISYYCDSIYFSKINIDLFANDYSDKNEYDQAIHELEKHDYMYVIDVSDSFNAFFGLLNNNQNYVKNQLYRIEKTPDGIRMEAVK